MSLATGGRDIDTDHQQEAELPVDPARLPKSGLVMHSCLETSISKLRMRMRTLSSHPHSVLLASSSKQVQGGVAFLSEPAQGLTRQIEEAEVMW